jgi:diguanylate cyclase (GGDEF)-like protein
MPLTLTHRSRLVGFAFALFAAALGAMLFLDVPALGIAYFLYLPIALVALATSTLSGAAAGIVAAEIYVLGELHGRGLPQADVVSTTSSLRLLTYACIGALVGKFAQDQRIFTRRLRTLAERDPLTGLLNTRAHAAALAGRIAAGQPFLLVLADLDGLKALNDRQGHAAGDDALIRFAGALAGAVRRGDSAARIGGDEFAVLVGQAGDREGTALCDRLETIAAGQNLGASFGWAAWPDDAADATSLFDRADRRLYERKAACRDRAAPAAAVRAGVPAESLG